MIRYEEIYYGNLSGGTLDGYCAITLELGTEKETSPSLLVNAVLGFGRTKIFRVSGEAKHSSKEDLYSLLSILKENNYITMVVLDGKVKEDWMDQATFRVVNITEAPWLMFGASEIHFQPMLKENLEPPQVAEIHSQARCYLDVNRDIPTPEIFDFLKRFPMWRIHVAPSKTYRLPISVREEE